MFFRDLFRGFSIAGRRKAVEVVLPVHPGVWSLDRPLVELSPGDAITTRDCLSGISIFGATGSGKTSGSLALLAKAMMRDGWGMLILTTRPGEADQWVRWAEQIGRVNDVIRIQPGGPHYFNFLDYLERHPDPGARIAANIGDLLMTLASYAKPKTHASETSTFFAESASNLVTQVIHLLRAADEPLTLANIGRVISSSPNHAIEVVQNSDFESRYASQLLRRAEANHAPNLAKLCDYFLREFPTMNERTRGDVVATLTAVVFRFTEEPFAQLIASPKGNSYIPELVDTGKLLILDAPVIRYQQAGRLYQIAIKHLTQQAILRRPSRDTTRPVVIFADEAQNFATHADYAYQAVCRDPRGCTVYATQTRDNYLEAVGSESSVEAMLASLVTKIFHANAGNTNTWAEKLIASDWRAMSSESMNQRDGQNRTSFGISQSEQLHPLVLAVEFTRLRTGGSRNGGIVDGIVFQPGRLFHQSGTTVLRVAFQQDGFKH